MKIDVQAIVDRRAAALRAMVDRFLRWKLPKDFHPDAGISFTPTKPYEGDEYGNSWWPIGTNLFSADQAAQMFRDCIPPECLDDCSSNQLTEVTTERDALQGEIDRLRAAVQGPYGYATWQEAATAERVRRVKAESVATIAHAERDALQLSVHRLVDDLVVVTAAAADAETELLALRAFAKSVMSRTASDSSVLGAALLHGLYEAGTTDNRATAGPTPLLTGEGQTCKSTT